MDTHIHTSVQSWLHCTVVWKTVGHQELILSSGTFDSCVGDLFFFVKKGAPCNLYNFA